MIKKGIEMNAEIIKSKIREAAGEELWNQTKYDVRITEKRSRVSSWKSTPMGMFIISIGYDRDRTAIHTKKDGSFDMAEVVQQLRYRQERRVYRNQREEIRSNNNKIAERVAQAAVEKGVARYISNYGKIDTAPAVVPCEGMEGKVAVGFGVTNLTEAQAARALELYAAMKKELEAYVA